MNISCLEIKNKDGLTPLHIAARCGTVKYVAIIQYSSSFLAIIYYAMNVMQNGY